jgi:hypothetical protein
MDLYDVMTTTFASRDFTDEPLPADTLFKILDRARFAPSGGNYEVTILVPATPRVDPENPKSREVGPGVRLVLRRLSENDLRELGVPLGPRKKILQAAAELSEQQTAKEPRTTDKVEPASADTAERRQITVLFTECCRFYSSVRPSGCRGPPFACLVARVLEIN